MFVLYIASEFLEKRKDRFQSKLMACNSFMCNILVLVLIDVITVPSNLLNLFQNYYYNCRLLI